MKDIYEMLNDIDINEKELELASVSELERERVKTNLKKAIGHKKLITPKTASVAAAIAFICMTSILAVKPALAKNIPIINKLFKQELMSVNKQYADYIDTIGSTKSYEGIDVTFESAVADDNMILLNTAQGASFEFIDNNTVRVLAKIDWSKYKVPNKINVDISISQLYGKSGDWGVRFFLDKTNQSEKTIEDKVNTKFDINGVQLLFLMNT